MAAAAVLLLLVVVSSHQTLEFVEADQMEIHSYKVLAELDVMFSMLQDVHIGQRGYVLTGEERFLEPFSPAFVGLDDQVRHLRQLTVDNPRHQQALEALEPLLTKRLALTERVISVRRQQGLEAARTLLVTGEGTPDMMTIRQTIEEMRRDEHRLLQQRETAVQSSTRATMMVLALGTILQFALLAAVYVLITRDIAERRRAEAVLTQQTGQLETANKELEAFSYSVSHDLRAPLRHIHGFAELLEKHAAAVFDEKGQRYLTKISESAQQMGTLIDALLTFSQVGRTGLHKTAVNLDQVVKNVLAELSPEPPGHRVLWKITPLPVVHGDRSLLQQVLINLIGNAVKYSRSRNPAIIEVGGLTTDKETIIMIRDNGVGFDMQYADKLFGVFQRLHSVQEFEGTGIGLAHVRRVVGRHGGRTWAEGAVDHGATFYFSLPRVSQEGGLGLEGPHG